MDDNPRRDHLDALQNENDSIGCITCQSLSCHSIHGAVEQDCLIDVKENDVNTDPARMDDAISISYQLPSNHAKDRQQIIPTPRDGMITIHHIPVEILSLIFIFVEQTFFSSKFRVYSPSHGVIRRRPVVASSQFLLGTVCRRWREVTLSTPQLWTDIMVSLNDGKSAEVQLDRFTKWVQRSGTLPLNITLSVAYNADLERQNQIWNKYEDLFLALTSLALRWNDVVLNVPPSFCSKLLNNLNLETSFCINTLFWPFFYDDDLRRSKPHHVLRPRHLISSGICRKEISLFKWDCLVYLFLEETFFDLGGILHIIQHAPNLKHCHAKTPNNAQGSQDFPIPTSLVSNRSINHLDTSGDMIGHLTLPSLQNLIYALDCRTSTQDGQYNDGLLRFLDRSCAPLDMFDLQVCVSEQAHFLPFERLPWITSLHIMVFGETGPTVSSMRDNLLLALTQPSSEVFLPCLKDLSFAFLDMTPLSWSLFCLLFNRTQLSHVGIILNSSPSPALTVALDRETFLRLLEIKRSGFDLTILDTFAQDLFPFLTQHYEVVL